MFSTRKLFLPLFLFLFACNGDKKPLDGPVAEGDAAKEVSNRLCNEYRDCECGELAGVSLAGCETGFRFSWEARKEDAKEKGLIYDGACLTKRLNTMLERGCAQAELGQSVFCGAETCLIYHGTKKEGEECEGGVSTADCEQGLICLGTCQKPCANTGFDIAEGEVCFDQEIDFYGLCAEGLVCDSVADGTCKALPADGEPCLNGQCEPGAVCSVVEGMQQCAILKAIGEACVGPQECDSLNCVDMMCAESPGEGETCLGKCADDLICALKEGDTMLTCHALPGDGEACLNNALQRCADGFTCSNGTCVTQPGDGQSCEPGADMIPLQCSGELICGAKLCALDGSAPGCNNCAPDDDTCVVRICSPIPPAVCGDSGGLLY